MFEVGKRYLRKNGTVTEKLVALAPSQDPYCFEDENFSYTKEGRLFAKDMEKLLTNKALVDYEGFCLDKEYVE